MDDMLERILRAPVYDVALETPLDEAELLSARLANRIWIKREDLQPVFSFKLRGAYNRIRNLAAGERRAGVVTASAGNHAQGVALAATRLGIDSLIVMPRTTPRIKVAAVERLGGRAVLEGDSYDEAALLAREIEAAGGARLRASLRRSRRDRRAGHGRHGNPAPAPRAASTRSSSRSVAADSSRASSPT